MTRSTLPFAAAVLFGTLASPAFAQGTAEQREACAPDAVRLCQDTIPDVERTTACMTRHKAELSRACRVVFNAATQGPGSAERRERNVARETPREVAPSPDDVPGEQRYLYLSPDGGARTARRAPADDLDVGPVVPPADDETADVDVDRNAADVADARRVVRRLCRNDVLDAGTCAVTRNALDLAN